MKNFGSTVVKARHLILILAFALLVPAVWGYTHTRVNYDILTYLPDSIETIKGQDILMKEFGTGAITMLIVEDKNDKDIIAMEEEIRKVGHVKTVLWYDSFADITIPKEMLPEKIRDAFIKGNATLLAITYDSSTSSDETMAAVADIRKVLDSGCYLQGMSAVITDTKDLAEAEEPIYVALAVLLSSIILALSMDTFLAPVFFLISIGIAIIYNLGSNYFFGEVSYITKALAAVLQLGVTMDYSIFLWHSFKENERTHEDSREAMAIAINETLKSVVGSSVTTIAGFAALCFMRFRFGLDVGLVMMKGVALGVVCCVTVLPSLILLFEKPIEKTRHRPLLPSFEGIAGFVQKHSKAVFIFFLLAWIPAIYGYTHYDVYYDIIQTLPKELPSMEANQKMDDTFSMNNTLMILADADLDAKSGDRMSGEIGDLEGVSSVISVDSFMGEGIPREMLPEEAKNVLYGGGYQLMLVASEYVTASDEMNRQIDAINEIIHRYDSGAMLIGDAPCTKDLITISNHDFNVVNWTSIGIIAAIILFVFTSLSLPILLVLVIECAIFINMGLAFYTGTSLPFIASIVIGTIQLGSTVDYAILMTSRYQTERRSGKDKREAVLIAHKTSIQSIFVSAMSFFAATFGVGMYSGISVISSLCMLMARGALISMVTVVLALPAILLLFDPVIIRTSWGFVKNENKLGSRETGLSHSM
ncbi:MAG: MMPL family transporter [Lachnospiraceae bacterium]|nr:MMPL family transporter [Lachnospiraceae bacterium]